MADTILKKWIEIWRSPYPQLVTSWKTIVIPTLIVFFILYLLQPFGISQLPDGQLGLSLCSAGVTALCMLLFTFLLPALFPRYYREERRTVGHYVCHLLALFLLITVGVWLVQSWWMDMWLDTTMFYYSLFWVLVLAPFPTIFFVMLNHSLQLKRNLREATEMNIRLAEAAGRTSKTANGTQPRTETPAEERISLIGSTKESLDLQASDFLYAEADGNYVAVYYLQETENRTESTDPESAGPPNGTERKMQRKLLRLTLKQAEAAVTGHTNILRCHRAFLVNMARVRKVEGNSQGYRLHLEGCTGVEVPVSRAYATAVKEAIRK